MSDHLATELEGHYSVPLYKWSSIDAEGHNAQGIIFDMSALLVLVN